jgi:HEPN domain-containing protein
MTVTSGLPEDGRSRDICRFYDDRVTAPGKIAFVHELLRRDASDMRPYFERIEKLLESLGEDEKATPEFEAVLRLVTEDRASRDRYLAYERRQRDPSLRARMIEVARRLGWLPVEELHAEQVRLVNDVLAGPVGFVEVDLVCGLNADKSLDAELAKVKMPAREPKVAQSAALACLGSSEAQAKVMRALASGDDSDVQAAQAYLRHRPPESSELRALALEIARRAGSGASLRSLDTLARLHVSDREILEELTRSYRSAKSVNVQRAIAEVFLRSDATAIPAPELAAALRQHRLRAPTAGEDLIDVLLRKLKS